jgi:hypothetical protein
MVTRFRDLAELLDQSVKEIPIEILAAAKINRFHEHYLANKDRIAKCYGWILHDEDGTTLNGQDVTIGFSEIEDFDRYAAPQITIRAPQRTLEEVGYKIGDHVENFTVFLEVANPKKVNIYLAKPRLRELSKREWGEIYQEVDEIVKRLD